jgi:hypothetical protein
MASKLLEERLRWRLKYNQVALGLSDLVDWVDCQEPASIR